MAESVEFPIDSQNDMITNEEAEIWKFEAVMCLSRITVSKIIYIEYAFSLSSLQTTDYN